MQEKYIEMKMLEEQMQQTQQQAKTVEQQLMEVMSSTQGLEEFKNIKKGDKILVPISSGIFVQAELKENRKFLINVGADTVITQDLEATKKLMERQVEEMKELNMKIQIKMQKLAIHASSTQEELKKLAEKV